MAAILALGGNGEQLMPLVQGGCVSVEARDKLNATNAHALFPHARAPKAAMAGLYLYFGCWNEAHEVAQNVGTPEGSYWHAIVHRQEPDAGNSAYWFRQVRAHPIFPALAKVAGVEKWDPLEFIRQCERGELALWNCSGRNGNFCSIIARPSYEPAALLVRRLLSGRRDCRNR